MKVHWLALLLIIGAVLSVPVVSAKIVEEKDGYRVMTGADVVRLPDLSSISSSSITQGETHWYSTLVSSGRTAFYSGLNWGNPSNSLSLTIIAPDSSLGPYYDSSDGAVDGRISLKIVKTAGLSPGTWWSDVYGYSVAGSQSYTYTAYAV